MASAFSLRYFPVGNWLTRSIGARPEAGRARRSPGESKPTQSPLPYMTRVAAYTGVAGWRWTYGMRHTGGSLEPAGLSQVFGKTLAAPWSSGKVPKVCQMPQMGHSPLPRRGCHPSNPVKLGGA